MRLFKTLYILVFLVPWAGFGAETKEHTLSGTVRSASTGEYLQRASILVSPSGAGTSTDSLGKFSITLTSTTYTVTVSHLGYSDEKRTINMDRNIELDVPLREISLQIQPAAVTARTTKAETAETSSETLTARDISIVPALFGEIDPLKAVQLTPGVQATSEGSSGFSVRGGNIDQNLILLDGATVYNASHVAGFFSVFNNDVLHDLKLYKGDIPAMYGGRLSALVDIRTREGNMRRYGVSGGIGLISSRLLVEGPIIRDKLSFLVAGRRTYLEIFKPFVREFRGNTMNFHDLNMSLNWQATPRTKVFLSGYSGHDNYGIEDAAVGYGNRTATLGLNRQLTPNLFVDITLTGSRFDNDYEMNIIEQFANKGSWWLESYGAKADIGYYYGGGHTLEAGYHATRHRIMKGEYSPNSPISVSAGKYIDPTTSLEQALYLSNELAVGKLSVRAGLRLNGFYNISNGKPMTILENYEPVRHETYRKGKVYQKRHRLDPRLGISYRMDERQTLKLSYTRTSQFLQMALNNASGLPINTWFEASTNIRPQISDQFAAGYYRDIKGGDYEFSFEAYYKDIRNTIDFKDHARLTNNDDLEQDVRTGKGYSYGLEFMLRKRTGRLTGWITYFLTRSMKKIDTINDGEWYKTIYDKPVNISIVANYRLTDKWNLSANWVLASGTPTTFPTGRAYVGGEALPGSSYIPVYSGRNNSRYPTYHRLDLAATFKLTAKRMERSELVFTLYNAYGRKNPWTIYFNHDDKNTIQANMYYLFSFTPSITWNFKF